MQTVIPHLHKCEPTHLESVHLEDELIAMFNADVELFELSSHPKAKRCYAGSYGEPEEFIPLLEIPAVDSLQSAVKVGIAHQVNQGRKGK